MMNSDFRLVRPAAPGVCGVALLGLLFGGCASLHKPHFWDKGDVKDTSDTTTSGTNSAQPGAQPASADTAAAKPAPTVVPAVQSGSDGSSTQASGFDFEDTAQKGSGGSDAFGADPPSKSAAPAKSAVKPTAGTSSGGDAFAPVVPRQPAALDDFGDSPSGASGNKSETPSKQNDPFAETGESTPLISSLPARSSSAKEEAPRAAATLPKGAANVDPFAEMDKAAAAPAPQRQTGSEASDWGDSPTAAPQPAAPQPAAAQPAVTQAAAPAADAFIEPAAPARPDVTAPPTPPAQPAGASQPVDPPGVSAVQTAASQPASAPQPPAAPEAPATPQPATAAPVQPPQKVAPAALQPPAAVARIDQRNDSVDLLADSKTPPAPAAPATAPPVEPADVKPNCAAPAPQPTPPCAAAATTQKAPAEPAATGEWAAARPPASNQQVSGAAIEAGFDPSQAVVAAVKTSTAPQSGANAHHEVPAPVTASMICDSKSVRGRFTGGHVAKPAAGQQVPPQALSIKAEPKAPEPAPAVDPPRPQPMNLDGPLSGQTTNVNKPQSGVVNAVAQQVGRAPAADPFALEQTVDNSPVDGITIGGMAAASRHDTPEAFQSEVEPRSAEMLAPAVAPAPPIEAPPAQHAEIWFAGGLGAGLIASLGLWLRSRSARSTGDAVKV